MVSLYKNLVNISNNIEKLLISLDKEKNFKLTKTQKYKLHKAIIALQKIENNKNLYFYGGNLEVEYIEKGKYFIQGLIDVVKLITELLNQNKNDAEIYKILEKNNTILHNDTTNKSSIQMNLSNIIRVLNDFEEKYNNLDEGYLLLGRHLDGDGGTCIDARIETLYQFIFEDNPFSFRDKIGVMGRILNEIKEDMCSSAPLFRNEYDYKLNISEFKNNFILDSRIIKGVKTLHITENDIEQFFNDDYMGFPLLANNNNPNVLDCDGKYLQTVGTIINDNTHIYNFEEYIKANPTLLKKGLILIDDEEKEYIVQNNAYYYHINGYILTTSGLLKIDKIRKVVDLS